MSANNKVKYESHGRFLFGEPPEFFDPFDATIKNGDIFEDIILTFRNNLYSAIQIGNVPYQLVHSSVLQQRFNSILASESILALGDDSSDEEEEKDRRARRKSHQRMEEELADPAIVKTHAKYTLETLDHHLSDSAFSDSADELLRQVIVMAWSALEVLSNDVFKIYLNKNPDKLPIIGNSKHIKNFINTRDMLIDALPRYDFNISDRLGDLLCDFIRLDSLEKIRDLFTDLFANKSLSKTLKSNDIWLLSQRRHIIVHNRAIIDSRYLDKTEDILPIGEKISVSPDYAEQCLFLVRDVGISIVKVASDA